MSRHGALYFTLFLTYYPHQSKGDSVTRWSKKGKNAHPPGFNSSTCWICLLWSLIQLSHALFMVAFEKTANSTIMFQWGEKGKPKIISQSLAANGYPRF